MPQVTPTRYFNLNSARIEFKKTFLSFFPVVMKLPTTLVKIEKYKIDIKKLDRTLSFPLVPHVKVSEIPQYILVRPTDCQHCPCVCSGNIGNFYLIKIFGFNPSLNIPQELSGFYIQSNSETYNLPDGRSFSITFSPRPYWYYDTDYKKYRYGRIMYLSIVFNYGTISRRIEQLMLCTTSPDGNVIYFSPSLSPSENFSPTRDAVSSIYATVQGASCGCPKGYYEVRFGLPSVTVDISEGPFQNSYRLGFAQRYFYSDIDFIRSFPCLWYQSYIYAGDRYLYVLFWSEAPLASGDGVYNFYLSDYRTNWQITFIASFDAKTGGLVAVNPIIGTNKVFLSRPPCEKKKADACQNELPYFACGCPPGYYYANIPYRGGYLWFVELEIDSGPFRGHYYLFSASVKSSGIVPYGVTTDPYSISDIDQLTSLCFWYTEVHGGYMILVWKKTHEGGGVYELYFNNELLCVFDMKTLEALYVTPNLRINNLSEVHLLYPPCYKEYYLEDSTRFYDNPLAPII